MPVSSTRRNLIKLFGSAFFLPFLNPTPASGKAETLHRKEIPASGEMLPVIGMGTWRTFNVGKDPKLRQARTDVLSAFFALGGRLIDCSPMYGSSSDTLGFSLKQIEVPDNLFAADKVWTGDGDATQEQVATQLRKWGIAKFDLMQVHNLVEWRDHLATLTEMKRNGQIRYIGITTSHGRRHSELEQIMAEEKPDFIQLTYNITHRQAEQHLLPLAREKGIAVIANRPYDGGQLIRSLKQSQAVPEWAKAEIECQTWADFLLKFIVSHPAITCAIPATTKVTHLSENMQSGYGPLPNASQRLRMAKHIASI
ncbi:MAG: aldo/keto reductase [Ketobacter sp.]|nr:MAG: aldo/keto reductase [Ketobacter sp.]